MSSYCARCTGTDAAQELEARSRIHLTSLQKFQVLSAVLLSFTVSWDVMPCRSASSSWYVDRLWVFIFRVRWSDQTALPWWWRQHGPAELCELPAWWHSVAWSCRSLWTTRLVTQCDMVLQNSVNYSPGDTVSHGPAELCELLAWWHSVTWSCSTLWTTCLVTLSHGPAALCELLAWWHSVTSQQPCNVCLAFLQSVTETLFCYNFSWYCPSVKILTLYTIDLFLLICLHLTSTWFWK